MRTGIRRKVDDLGRVVIPAGIRRTLNIREGDSLEVHVEGDQVVLARPVDQCIFCRGADGLQTFRERSVCRACLVDMGALEGELRSSGVVEPTSDAAEGGLPPWPFDVPFDTSEPLRPYVSQAAAEPARHTSRQGGGRREATKGQPGERYVPASSARGDEPPPSTTAW